MEATHTPEINFDLSPGFTVIRDAAHLKEVLDAATASNEEPEPVEPDTEEASTLSDFEREAVLYRLSEWEDNGYHDSYFHVALWNEDKQIVERVEFGATAYAGGWNYMAETLAPTKEIVGKACAWLANVIYRQIWAAEQGDVLEPKAVSKGQDLRLIRSARNKGVTVPKGAVGRVFWSGAYGTFYKNGYNRPGRNNIRVGLELTTGERVFVALSACRLDREPMGDEELRQRAENLSLHCSFRSALTAKGGWDSKNFALAVLQS